jgi:hypothetical protein
VSFEPCRQKGAWQIAPRTLAQDTRRAIMMKIEILGTGCPRCDTLAANAKEAAQRLGIEFRMEKTRDIR